jgi:molybdopterin biosynthesis enzyme
VRLATPVRQRPGRLGLYRGRVRGEEVELFDNQASGATTAIAWANCFAVVPADVEELAVGSSIEVFMHADF